MNPTHCPLCTQPFKRPLVHSKLSFSCQCHTKLTTYIVSYSNESYTDIFETVVYVDASHCTLRYYYYDNHWEIKICDQEEPILEEGDGFLPPKEALKKLNRYSKLLAFV